MTSQVREDRIVIEISDAGGGIPPELFVDIYAPFVTTKKEGTGLGLPIVHKIITAHKGSIDVIENSDTGVTFRISFPLIPGKKKCRKAHNDCRRENRYQC